MLKASGTYDVYRREGGYRSVEKALKQWLLTQVTEEVKKSGCEAVVVQVFQPE